MGLRNNGIQEYIEREKVFNGTQKCIEREKVFMTKILVFMN